MNHLTPEYLSPGLNRPGGDAAAKSQTCCELTGTQAT